MRKDGHKPLLIVIAGPNGSGKTSVTSQLLKSEWVEDAIFRLSNGYLGKLYVATIPEWARNIFPETT